MKNLIGSTLIGILLVISTSCQKQTEDVVPSTHRGSARMAIDLDEVVVTGYRPDYSNVFESIYKLSIGNDYHVTSDPYSAFTEEYAGEDINDIPHIIDVVLTRLNMELRNHQISSFKDEEMAILRTLTVKQIFQIYTAIVSANNLANVAMNQLREPSDDGYSNAFRHFYLAYGVARAIGVDAAARYMAAHEANETGLSTQMDTKNNDYALYIFRNNLAGTDYITYNFLTGLAQNGHLWIIKDGILGQFPMPTNPSNNGPQL